MQGCKPERGADPSDPPGEGATRRPQWLADLGGCAVLVSVFCAFFFRTVFQGKPIAHLGVLERVDAFVNPSVTGSVIDLGGDPSGFLIFFPLGLFSERMWSQMVPPLWNPYSGCGYPLFADPQSFIWSPVHLLGVFSSPEAYNTGLLLEILVGILGVFFLGRRLGLSTWAGVLAASAYGFCPRNLADVDLNGSDCFFSWLLLAFVWAAEKQCVVRSCLVGLACGFVPYMAHPEPSLFGAFYGAVLYLVLRLFSGSGPWLARAGKAVVDLLPVVLVAILISAPLAIPLAEFMKQAFFYKESSSAASVIQVDAFVSSFLAAQGKAPYFMGTPTALLMVLGIASRGRIGKALSITFFVALALTVPVGPLPGLLSLKPLSYVATVYGMPELLILMALLAGCGLDYALGRISRGGLIAFAAACLVTCVLPLLVVCQVAYLPDAEILGRALEHNRTLVLMISGGSLLTLAIVLSTRLVRGADLSTPAKVSLFAGMLLLLNFSTEATVGRMALPPTAPYKCELPKGSMIGETEGRFIATGNNFFLPNTATTFKHEDLRTFSPLLPLRYQKFVTAAGATSHNLYFMDMPDSCSPLLDLASVKYVLTRGAIQGAELDGSGRELLTSLKTTKIADGFRIISGEFSYDRINRQFDGELVLRVHDCADGRYALEWAVASSDGSCDWRSCQTMVHAGPNHLTRLSVHLPVPLVQKASTKPGADDAVRVSLKVIDTWTGQALPSGSIGGGMSDSTRIVSIAHPDSRVPLSFAGGTQGVVRRHFSIVGENNPQVGQERRLYLNNRSLPEAFFVESFIKARDDEEAFSLVSAHDFDPRRNVVVEGELPAVSGTGIPADSQQDLLDFDAAAKREAVLARPDCNTVVIKTDRNADGYLVLTDLFYPGWQCSVDGQPAHVQCANYMFRVVYVPRGKHDVRFSLSPQSLQAGFWLALGGVLFVIGVGAYKFNRRSRE